MMKQSHGQVKHKHSPERTCVVCRVKQDKRTLNRVIHNAQLGITFDASGKMNGRGAYLCNNPLCWERAVNTNILEKALRVALTPADRQRIQQAHPSS